MEQKETYDKGSFGKVPDSRRSAIAHSLVESAFDLLGEAHATLEEALEGRSPKETVFQNYARSSMKIVEVAIGLVEFESWVRDDREVWF